MTPKQTPMEAVEKTETNEEASVRLAKLMETIMNDKDGRKLVSTIITANRESDRCEREARKWEGKVLESEMELRNKFKISWADYMNIKIAIDWEGIENIFKKKIDRVVI